MLLQVISLQERWPLHITELSVQYKDIFWKVGLHDERTEKKGFGIHHQNALR